MSTQAFIRWMIDSLTEDMDKLSHDLAGRALEHSDYLISVGKYRQMRTIVEKLKQRLAETDERPQIDDAEPEPVSVEVKYPPKPRISKPRPWGGGR